MMSECNCESIDILDFLHGDKQRKTVSERTTFGRVLPVVPLASCYPTRLQDSLIIRISGMNQVISFFWMELVTKVREQLRLKTFLRTLILMTQVFLYQFFLLELI